MGYTRNAVLIHAPVDQVFALTNNVRTWPSLFTEYESSVVQEETEGSVTFRLTTVPDADGQQWSWIAVRKTDNERRSTYSEREPSSGPFERMIIRWWYDPVGPTSTVMTWEQEFTMKASAPVSEAAATNYLNTQTHIQQKVIKERVEAMCGAGQDDANMYRGMIVGRYQAGKEDAIVEAFAKSDQTELPTMLGVKSRHVWVLGDIYMHFVEGAESLPGILKDSAGHPLFKEIKAELDNYVQPLSPKLYPGVAKEIYRWQKGDNKA